MITVTGTLEDSAGRALHKKVTFVSKSTPQAGGSGLVTGNSTVVIFTNQSTGQFTVDLRPGNYSVIYSTLPRDTSFNISISDELDGTSVSIEQLIVDDLAELPGVAPYTVWNGTRAGHVTFQPIDDPAAPSVSEVAYTGGHSTSQSYAYVITHVTPDGETAPSPIASITGSGAANKAIRVQLEVSPARVTAKRIWRNKNNSSSTLWLLAEVGPTTPYYDDWESSADFAARADTSLDDPKFNTTAGIIYAKSGSPILYFSTSGLRCLTDATFDSTASFCGGLFSLNPDGTPNIATGAAAGYVLTSDANGKGTWQAASGGLQGIDGQALTTPAGPPSDQTKPALWYNKTGLLQGWDTVAHAWVPIIS